MLSRPGFSWSDGASQPSSNGTFSTIVDGGTLFVEDEFGGPPILFMGKAGDTGNNPMVFDLPLVDIRFSLFAPNAPDPIPSEGDPIRVSDFPASGSGSLANHSSGSGGTDPIGVFSESNEQLSAIPEPASAVLLAIGILALATRGGARLSRSPQRARSTRSWRTPGRRSAAARTKS